MVSVGWALPGLQKGNSDKGLPNLGSELPSRGGAVISYNLWAEGWREHPAQREHAHVGRCRWDPPKGAQQLAPGVCQLKWWPGNLCASYLVVRQCWAQ